MENTTQTPTPAPSKPWYQSKIILLAGTAVLVYGSNAMTGFLTGAGVTPEQIEVIRSTQPQIADAVEQFKTGQNVLSTIVGGVIPLLIVIARKWFNTISLLR